MISPSGPWSPRSDRCNADRYAAALLLEHDDWRIAQAHQAQIQGQPPGSAVSIDERMDLFEPVMQPRQLLRKRHGEVNA